MSADTTRVYSTVPPYGVTHRWAWRMLSTASWKNARESGIPRCARWCGKIPWKPGLIKSNVGLLIDLPLQGWEADRLTGRPNPSLFLAGDDKQKNIFHTFFLLTKLTSGATHEIEYRLGATDILSDRQLHWDLFSPLCVPTRHSTRTVIGHIASSKRGKDGSCWVVWASACLSV